VPSVWDDTKVPDGEVGKHIVVARQSGNAWFLGALTDSIARELPVKLDFLGSGSWKLRLWRDAADSNVNAEHLEVEERTVTAADILNLRLAPAGGCVARFQKE
jgi:alpha-glucosidase